MRKRGGTALEWVVVVALVALGVLVAFSVFGRRIVGVLDCFGTRILHLESGACGAGWRRKQSSCVKDESTAHEAGWEDVWSAMVLVTS